MDAILGLLQQDFLQSVFTIVLGFAGFVLKVLLFPINALIHVFLPDLSMIFDLIANVFNITITYINWIIDMLLLPPLAYEFAVLYYGFILFIGMAAFAIRTALIWLLKLMAAKLW